MTRPVAILLVLASLARAHPDADQRLRALARRADGCDVDGLLLRADLIARSGRFEAALLACDRAAACGGGAVVELARGRLLLEAGWPHAARSIATRVLSRHPEDRKPDGTPVRNAALLLRARASVQVARPAEALPDFARVTPRLTDLQPDLVLERARAALAAGDPAAALAALDEGIARLGPTPALSSLAASLAASLGRPDDALRRLDRLAAAGVAREQILVERAAILDGAGRPAEARAARMEALDALSARAPHRRATPALRDLERRLRRALVAAR